MDKSDTEANNPSNALVALYLTEETGLPCYAKGYKITSFEAENSAGARIQRPGLRVTFETGTSIKQPRHLLTFGSDDQHCNVVLKATEASPIHCKIYAQVNSGPNVWVLEDTSTSGTEYLDAETLRTRISKNVARGRVAVQGLCRIQIGRNIFSFWSPSDDLEKCQLERYFRDLDPVPVTQEVIEEQLRGIPAEYCSVAMIGKGGMAEVFQYIETTTGLMVAVKEEEVRTKKGDKRVRKEIGYMQSLKHPNLVEYITSSSTNAGVKKWFTVMPLYQGRLLDILPLEVPAVENVMLQLFEAVAYMHAQRILHKDIKPENVLVKGKARPDVVLADYGLCASLNMPAELMSSAGTPGYSAPEVSRKIVQTEAVDVFALGATFLFILEPQRCRGHSATLATFRNVMRHPPKVYAGLVQSMMAPNAQERPSLKECFGVVKAKQRGWRKCTPLAYLLPRTTSTPGPRRSLRLQKAVAQELPTNNSAKCAAWRARFEPFVDFRQPQRHPRMSKAPERRFKIEGPIGKRQGPKLTALPAPVREPQAPAPVQQVNFAAPPPSSPDNPFAHLNRTPDTVPPARRQALPAIPEPTRNPIRRPDNEIKRMLRRRPERRQMIERWQKIRVQKNKICDAIGEVASGTPLNIFRGLCHLTAGGVGITGQSLGLIFHDMVAADDALHHIVGSTDYWRMTSNVKLIFGLRLNPHSQLGLPLTPEEYAAERLQSEQNFPNTTEGRRVRARLDREAERARKGRLLQHKPRAGR